MSNCDCENKIEKKSEDTWPMEGDVGDNFLIKDNFPMILQIKRNLKNYTINKEAIFNQQLIEDKLKNLNLDDMEDEEIKRDILIDEDSDIDSEEILTTSDEETSSEASSSEGEDVMETEEESSDDEEVLENVSPEPENILIEETPKTIEKTSSEVKKYLEELL